MSDFYELTPDEQEARYRQLAKLVLPEWGLGDATLTMIKMRENAVFRVDTPDGRKEILRIHRANYHTNDELRSELRWIQALAAAGVDTPDVIPTVSGELFLVPESGLAGLPRQIDMFAWVDGEQLGSVEEGLVGDLETLQDNFRTIGALAARVHNQASGWQIPDGFVRHAWDVDGLTGEQPFWGRFWDLEALTAAQRDLMITTRVRVRDGLVAFGQAADKYSLIHADMVPENVLVDGGHIRLIDFDDAGYGWHLFDMATSLYFSSTAPNIDELTAAYVDGYRSQRKLSDEDLGQLPLFMMARATTYLGWIHTRKETETARELTPMIVEMACTTAEKFLAK